MPRSTVWKFHDIFLSVRFYVKSITELGRSLIGIFDCGYFTVLKVINFPVTLILREINSGWFQKVKNCRFNHFGGFELLFLDIFHTQKCQKFPKIQNSYLLKWSKWLFLGLYNDLNWFHVKSEWQKNPEISTLCIPN